MGYPLAGQRALQDHRGARELPQPGDGARPPAAVAVVLPQAAEHRWPPTATRSRGPPAASCSPSRARSRSSSARRARRVILADAWEHVRWVTAANDFGVYDLRVRRQRLQRPVQGHRRVHPARARGCSTPGPSTRRRLRCGPGSTASCAQDAVSGDDLLFSFADIVADLSRLTTLEPGDVILTGTPTGSTVVGPATWSRSRSTRRATAAASPPGGCARRSPQARLRPVAAGRDAQPGRRAAREAAYGAARRASGPPTRRPTCCARLERGQHRHPRRRSCAGAASTPSPSTGCTPPARQRRWSASPRTLRYVPFREDLFAAGTAAAAERAEARGRAGRPGRGPGHRGPRRRPARHGRRHPRAARPGPRRGRASSPTARCATARRCRPGPAGLLRRGATRRCSAAGTCRGRSTARSPAAASPVQPGDIIVGDADGVIVIPAAPRRGGGAGRRRAGAPGASSSPSRSAKGESVDGLYPLGPRWQAPTRRGVASARREESPMRFRSDPAADPRLDRARRHPVHRRRRGRPRRPART